MKAQVFRDQKPASPVARVPFPTRTQAERVEVAPELLLRAVAQAIAQTGELAMQADCIGLSVMAPAWLAMDASGAAITPIITHQDRRSASIAKELEARVGKKRHLALAGNRPFPGSISSTTCAWFLQHEPELMKPVDLVGHLNTFLVRKLTGARVIDPSNASFTGLYLTCSQSGWSNDLCEAVGVKRQWLPDIVDSDGIAGHVTPEAAAEFGLKAGTPVLAGMVDTGAAILLTGANDGQLFHMCGSTDVLAACVAKPRTHERLLTRALGVGKKSLSVATIAAAGSSLEWVRREFFRDLSEDDFYKLTGSVRSEGVGFQPYLAGERMAMEQPRAAFSGLKLATTRENMLAAVVGALSAASAARLELLAEVQPIFLPLVYVSGGGRDLARIMHQDWAGRWEFKAMEEANLAGLATLVPR